MAGERGEMGEERFREGRGRSDMSLMRERRSWGGRAAATAAAAAAGRGGPVVAGVVSVR
jgi:hypothetical protein